MTHYVFAEKKKLDAAGNPERWETLAAFLTLIALVALAGITYTALSQENIYNEVKKHDELTRFAGMLDDSMLLRRELEDSTRRFTLIAPTDGAFAEKGVVFNNDDNKAVDKRIVRIEGKSYILQSEAYVVRSEVTEEDVPYNDVLNLPAANGDIITLSREPGKRQTFLKVNGVPVVERVEAENGVIYLVDRLVHTLYPETSPSLVKAN